MINSIIDEKTNRNIEGTGLGLSITKKFTDMMGGTIGVDSVLYEGSTFTVTIPQKIADKGTVGHFDERLNKRGETSSSDSDSTDSSDKKDKFTAPHARILVVDDVKMNLLVVKGLIKKTLISVDTAQSGIECINKVLEKKYDMVLIDDMMPNMSGVETYNKLQNEYGDKIKDIPFIMLTANALDGMEDYYRDKGFAGYYYKQFPFGIMPMLPFCNPGPCNIYRKLSGGDCLQYFRKTSSGILFHIKRIFHFTLRKVR